ncbi:MAG: hypothetical protein FJX23_04880 [Alphaproteobacteria bacterium]|nr:hypothetical protein [Alphaproteobacteria bacterium]
MAIGKRISRAFKGEEELKVVFWQGVLPGTIAVILLTRYVLAPYIGIGIAFGVIFSWLLLCIFCMNRCWSNTTSTFQEEMAKLLRFLGVVWLAAVLMSPIFYMLYIDK